MLGNWKIELFNISDRYKRLHKALNKIGGNADFQVSLLRNLALAIEHDEIERKEEFYKNLERSLGRV